ncbi:unnamed protein product, partial [Ectocarpus sp. 12 AP-2014]
MTWQSNRSPAPPCPGILIGREKKRNCKRSCLTGQKDRHCSQVFSILANKQPRKTFDMKLESRGGAQQRVLFHGSHFAVFRIFMAPAGDIEHGFMNKARRIPVLGESAVAMNTPLSEE